MFSSFISILSVCPLMRGKFNGDPGIHKGIYFIHKDLNMEFFRVVTRQLRINKSQCIVCGLYGAKACGQEFTAEGEEEAGNFIQEFIPHYYLNA
jgi:hypothetical protein